jgi:hypothetical protein
MSNRNVCKPGTKIAAIRDAFLRGEKLTPLKAMAYGTQRLPEYVRKLRNYGYDVKVTYKTDGRGVQFAEYFIPDATDVVYAGAA